MKLTLEDYKEIISEEIDTMIDRNFTGKAEFTFDFNDGGIGKLSLNLERNLTSERKKQKKVENTPGP